MFKLSFFVFICLKCAASVHLTDSNLITDASGIVKFKDNYHVFYQSFELDLVQDYDLKLVDISGLVNWGHATTKNFIEWQILPKIIGPIDDPTPVYFRGEQVANFSKLLPFSGSAFVDSQNATGLLTEFEDSVLLVFTSLSKFLYDQYDSVTDTDNFIFSTVNLFYSYDGIHFTKYNKDLINRSETIRNFRDPYVFQNVEGDYNLIMEENVAFGIHKSSDLINWEKVSTFNYEPWRDELEWETPNLLRFEDQYLLVCSSNRKATKRNTHFSTVKYFVGTFDGRNFEVDSDQVREFDGPDLYAISISDENIMLGMINNWEYLLAKPFNGALSYPRRIGKLELRNQTYLTQRFINLNAFSELLTDQKNIIDHRLAYTFIVNRPHYLNIKLKRANCIRNCHFKFIFSDTNNTIRLGYDSNKFYLDRSESVKVDEYYNDVHKYKVKYSSVLDEFDIDIILDVNSIEMLTDQGIVSMTALHLNNRIFQNFTLLKSGFNIVQFTVAHYP